MNDHHLVLGTLIDFLSGAEIPDTLDERYRQALARLLVENKQYAKAEITKDQELVVVASDKKARIKIDYTLRVNGRCLMLIKYGPGSITTRHRPALAASRLIEPYQIPCVVVTNGEDADILSGKKGTLLGQGFENIPTRSQLISLADTEPTEPLCGKRTVLESRILYAFEVDGSCPCDTDICRIEP
jgi:hypothetical protein